MNDAERKLIRFAAKVIDLYRGPGWNADINGGDLHDAAESCGVIVPVPVTEPCSDVDCSCAECDAIPGECYRLEAMVQVTMAAAEQSDEGLTA